MRWLALHLPLLPLEAFPSPLSPRAVVCHERIVVGDAQAEAAGVQPGMRLSGAWALLPDLAIEVRDPVREAALLQRLACCLGALTPEISLREQGLLLEISGSLQLFGGESSLRARVLAACREQGLSVQTALAPTPLAAEWLAQAGAGDAENDLARLPLVLGNLPIALLGLPEKSARRLAGFGARTLGDVLRLPRAGLARRLGAGVAASLARALGEVPDLRPRFAFPAQFAQALELPARVDNAQALGFAGQRLLAALCGWLAARNAGVMECTFVFAHERGVHARPPTILSLGFAAATRDLQRCVRVLTERLLHLQLPAAVESLRLQADSPVPLTGRSGSLFAGTVSGLAEESEAAILALIERLCARLGSDKVHGLALTSDYRPENAARRVSLPAPKTTRGSETAAPVTGPRPLWLLPQPQALAERAGRPTRGGPLQLLAGPERIESGWWDADETGAVGDVRRDYFVARSPRGECLWIFRDAAGWFLHGLFA